MKIQIREARGRGFTIPIPNCLLFSPTLLETGLKIGKRYAGTSVPDIPPEILRALCAAVKDLRRRYGTWELVHVESAGGDLVSIII